ncbi:MAG TPA: hypothetical protein VKG85_02385 [Actinomycetes bacterium]|nr:hypothetical protein [Actinomycetes bacterium]
MSATIYKLVRALSGAETGRTCRRCTESIRRADYFGMSEGVCGPCRVSFGG